MKHLNKKNAVTALVLIASVVAPTMALADAADVTAAITAAQTQATSSVELTTTGMIQIVAVVVGIGLIVGLLKRI